MMFEILSFCMEFMKLYFVAYVFKQNFLQFWQCSIVC